MNNNLAEQIIAAIQPMSRRELETFISSQPLYTFYRVVLPDLVNNIAPRVVRLYCGLCKEVMPFRAMADDTWFLPVEQRHIQKRGPLAGALQEKMSGVYEFYFRCSECDHNTLLCWIEVNYETSGIRKVGQSIAWSIEIPKELERDLGEDAKLYKKALVLLSQSYGIGACAYLRRIVENQINPLLAILLEMKQREGAAAEELEEIREAIKRKDFTSKIETAATILPSSITVEGHNPVKLIHDQLSINIHSLSDDEVMPIALRLKTAVEYAVVELNRQKKSKQRFIDDIRAIAQKDKP
jgi:hypothetical protein